MEMHSKMLFKNRLRRKCKSTRRTHSTVDKQSFKSVLKTYASPSTQRKPSIKCTISTRKLSRPTVTSSKCPPWHRIRAVSAVSPRANSRARRSLSVTFALHLAVWSAFSNNSPFLSSIRKTRSSTSAWFASLVRLSCTSILWPQIFSEPSPRMNWELRLVKEELNMFKWSNLRLTIVWL